jgi:hypothetical protein
MFRRLLQLLLRLYPSAWRARYGDELVQTAADLGADQERSKIAMLVGVVAAATHARIQDISENPPRRRVVSLGGVTLAAVTAAIVMLSAGTFDRGSGVAATRGHAAISPQLAADVHRLCGSATAGKQVTFVEMNPNTGRVIAKVTHRCDDAG